MSLNRKFGIMLAVSSVVHKYFIYGIFTFILFIVAIVIKFILQKDMVSKSTNWKLNWEVFI